MSAQPLELLHRNGKDLTRLGGIGDLIRAGTVPLPPVHRDDRPGIDIEGTETSKVNVNVGVTILGASLILGKKLDEEFTFGLRFALGLCVIPLWAWTRRITSRVRSQISCAVAPPRFTVKFACLSEIAARPISKPLRPAASISAPA